MDPSIIGIFTLQCAAMSFSTTAACPLWAAIKIAVAPFVVNARSTLQRQTINCSTTGACPCWAAIKIGDAPVVFARLTLESVVNLICDKLNQLGNLVLESNYKIYHLVLVLESNYKIYR